MNKTYKTALLLLAGVSIFTTAAPVVRAQEDAKSSFTEEQKKELNDMFVQFIKNNPVLIMESVQQFHEDQQKKAQQTAQESLKEYQEVFAGKDMPMMGNPDGDVTIVEFFDYNCGYCKKAFSDLIKLIEEDKNVRVVFQDLPILSPSSRKMAELSVAAHKQGKYFEFHKALMEYRGGQSDDDFMKLAKESGLDMEQLKKDSESDEVKAAVSKIRSMAQRLGIQGTPGFVIGDEIYPGYIGINGLHDAIKKSRQAASPAKE